MPPEKTIYRRVHYPESKCRKLINFSKKSSLPIDISSETQKRVRTLANSFPSMGGDRASAVPPTHMRLKTSFAWTGSFPSACGPSALDRGQGCPLAKGQTLRLFYLQVPVLYTLLRKHTHTFLPGEWQAGRSGAPAMPQMVLTARPELHAHT